MVSSTIKSLQQGVVCRYQSLQQEVRIRRNVVFTLRSAEWTQPSDTNFVLSSRYKKLLAEGIINESLSDYLMTYLQKILSRKISKEIYQTFNYA
jgi:hypothetical protein